VPADETAAAATAAVAPSPGRAAVVVGGNRPTFGVTGLAAAATGWQGTPGRNEKRAETP